jgi:ELWxxDGT repeat protein
MRLLTRKLVLLSLVGALVLVSEVRAATGARLLADLNPGSVGSYPSNFTGFGGALYFSAYTLQTGFELWRYNGSTVTLAADINPTADDIGSGVLEGNDSIPAWLTEFGGQLYFSAFHPARGAELWRFDGSQAARVSDINPDLNDAIKVVQNSAWPYQLAVLNDTLYFGATSNTTPPDYELWRYNASGVQQVTNLHPQIGADYSSYPTELTLFNGALYFMADDGAHGWELWRHDGAGTRLFDLYPGGPETSSYPKDFTPFNNELYFAAFDAASGFELWRTDGNTATLAVDGQPGAESSYPKDLTVYNGALYFQGFDAATGYELRKFTGGQSTLAADINTAGDSAPKHLTVLGNLLVFAATDGIHGWELWKYDGTAATMVMDLNPAGDAFPEDFTVLDGILYFTATTPETGYELWKFDGTMLTLAAEVNVGPGDSFPRSITVVNGQLYFSAADDGSSNWEPWVLDATTPTNQPPTVSLTAPAPGATFLTTDNITFSANATGESGVARVEFYADALLLGTDDSAPFSVSTNLPAGSHSITARAVDTTGAEGFSSAVTITVNEPSANQPPTVTLTSPAEGATFLTTDTITFAANATDDIGVARVEFFANGAPLGSDPTAPYSVLSALSAGTYEITAKAFDGDGAVGTSAPVNISVTQVTGNEPPTVTLTVEPAGRLLAPATVTLRAVATDTDGIAEVLFFNGGTQIGTDTTAPYQVTRSDLAAGNYSFTAVARDNLGASTTSTTIEVRVVEAPVLSIARTGASVVLTVNATAGVPHALQASADLVNWTTIDTQTPASGMITFTETASATNRFYRAVVQ